MSKLKILLLAVALVFTGTVAQTQAQVKQQCSYEGKAYADGATNPIAVSYTHLTLPTIYSV